MKFLKCFVPRDLDVIGNEIITKLVYESAGESKNITWWGTDKSSPEPHVKFLLRGDPGKHQKKWLEYMIVWGWITSYEVVPVPETGIFG